jgi:membrane protease YdiL (CAAX protease family)
VHRRSPLARRITVAGAAYRWFRVRFCHTVTASVPPPARLPQPGWYTDPFGVPGSIRWWTGDRWSEAAQSWVAPPPPPSPQVQAPARPARTLPARAVWWALLGLAVGEVAGGILAAIAAAVTGDSTGAAVTLTGEIGLWGGMLGACLFVTRRYGTGSLRRDFGLGWRPVDVGWGPLVTVSGLILTAVLSQPFAGTRLSGSNTQLIDGQIHNTAGFAVIAVIVSVGAPVFEELFFRGLVRAALTARLGPIGAVFAQAGLFGLAHVNPTTGLGNVEVVVIIGAFGVLLGLVAHLTGRLGAGMVGHGLYNLLVTVSVLTR